MARAARQGDPGDSGGRHRGGRAEENKRIPPVFWLVLAGACLVAIFFLAAHGLRSVENQQLVNDRTRCDAAPSGPCLDRVSGELRGPDFTRRKPGNGWSLLVEGAQYDSFDMPGSADRTLEALDGSATVLTRDGDVVAVELGDGSVIRTWGLGWRDAVQSLLWIAICAGLLIGAVDFALRRRRAVGSWWRVHGAHYVSPASPLATQFLLPGLAAFMTMAVGTPWWQLWLAVFAGALVCTLAVIPPSSPRWSAFRADRA